MYTKPIQVSKNHILNSILVLLLIAISFATFFSYTFETEKRTLTADKIELSDIKYGMFNIDAWEEQFAEIITKKLKELKLTGDDRKEARVKIRAFLYEAIEKFETTYKSKNDQKASFSSLLRNAGADFFEIFGELKQHVPVITEDILDFLENDENRDNIKKYILEQINTYTDGTFQKIDYTTYNNILSKYNAASATDCNTSIAKKLEITNGKQNLVHSILIIAFLCILAMMLFLKNQTNFKITVYVLAAFHLLILGVFLPMIAIDARISSMELQLMGEPISFTNQVLYYKSKSIMEVAKVMLLQGELKVLLVGVLVLLFSVIFPVSKLVASLLLVFKRSFQQNKIIRFLVFKSGKWSMADVLVVAIFMAYIGFTGIISSQLGQLENGIESLEILTTNQSELQNGFFFFMGFVIFSIFISQMIQKLLDKSNTAIKSQ
ncbi:paraquat-inducible protein A [Kordia jejudonensis]|uniref:paraquat-inducible protein A n=1 Tax=Kordia jejudonensis TaxID=1348245 RepID=UPI00069B89F9|nr:paraquat-inducible protein A [Kordia jejudonensis]